MNKKIIILVLGCREDVDPFFFKEYKECCKQTWAKDLPENIKVIYYKGGNETKLEDDILTVACEDDFPNTYKKTYLALQYINQHFYYDFVFRTNTSTYINTYVLNLFFEYVYNEKYHYGSDLYSLSEACCPYPLGLYARGNGIILNKKEVQNILYKGINILYLNQTDDIGIGNILNTCDIEFSMKNNIKFDYKYKGITHTWYKSIDRDFYTGHKFSTFNKSALYHSAITTTIKKYRDREIEFNNYFEYHNLVSNIEYPPKHEIVTNLLRYSENPSIFLGSVIGYIEYNLWKRVDKNKLFILEKTHKAIDDEQFDENIQEKYEEFGLGKIQDVFK